MRSLLVLAVFVSGSIAQAAFVGEQELGDVVAVKRTFTVDLAKCEAAWKTTIQGAGATSYGTCEIEETQPIAGETSTKPFFTSWDEKGPYPNVVAEIRLFASGYALNYSDNQGIWKGDFATARAEFEKLLQNQAPDGKVSITVHTIRGRKSLRSYLGLETKPGTQTYQFTANGCDTGKHTFEGSRTESATAQLCKALKDEKTNKSCALDLRKAYFAQNCPGQTW